MSLLIPRIANICTNNILYSFLNTCGYVVCARSIVHFNTSNTVFVYFMYCLYIASERFYPNMEQ